MNSGPQTPEGVIIADWGTTSLRAALVDRQGKVTARIETQRGIRFIKDGAFESDLMAAIGPWLEKYGALDVVALGMITSKNGWVEVPYVPCPADVPGLARGTVRRMLPNGSQLLFLAGINDPSGRPFPDVMRGEETQIIGYGLKTAATIVLPGTHSKWAQITPGRIERFQTFITGEIYALLSTHSFIGNVGDGAGDAMNRPAFIRGVTTAKGAPGQSAAFLSLLFSARTGMLCNALNPGDIRDYVSGMVIGHEFREACDLGWFKAGDTIGIVGNDGLNARYDRAAKLFDLKTKGGNTDAAITGALLILAALKGET
jgi:2-dehydro-3-deoxygalactonokinase